MLFPTLSESDADREEGEMLFPTLSESDADREEGEMLFPTLSELGDAKMNCLPGGKMQVCQYLARVLARSNWSRDNPDILIRDTRDAFAHLQSLMRANANFNTIYEAIVNSYNFIVSVRALHAGGVCGDFREGYFRGVADTLSALICSTAILTPEHLQAIYEWCGGRADILEVYGGSGFNAAVLRMESGFSVRSTDISTAKEPDIAGCDDESARTMFRIMMDRAATLGQACRSFFDVEKLDAVDAITKYADAQTLLFMCCPPSKPGTVERAIEAFHSKGGEKIVLIGCEPDGIPCQAAWATLRRYYEIERADEGFYDCVPVSPMIVAAEASTPILTVQFYTRR